MMPAKKLSVVNNVLPEPPYPSDLLARGWVLNLDLPRLWQSTTWALTPVSMRAYLYAILAVSWEQRPIGTLPMEDDAIAGMIGMDPALFRAHRSTLLRNWYACSGGRLYHPVVTEFVNGMIERRHKDRARVAAWRQSKKQIDTEDVTRYTPVTNALVTREYDTDSDTDTTNLPPSAKDADGGVLVAFAPARAAPPEASPTPDGSQGPPGPAGASPPAVPDCPHEAIVAAYHAAMPANPRVERWTEARRAHLRARWREWHSEGKYRTEAEGVEWWAKFFRRCADSRFLTGRVTPKDGGKVFIASLAWIVKPENHAKIREGAYHDDGPCPTKRFVPEGMVYS